MFTGQGQCSECYKSELELFSTPPLNTSMDKGNWVEFRPIATITSGSPIEFNVAATDDDYTDISRTYLYMQATIRKTNREGANLQIDETDSIAPINLWLHSLFSQIDIKLNGTLVTPSINTYPYRSYLETLLSYGEGAKQGQLTMQGWHQDTSGEFDNITLQPENNKNEGFKARKKIIAQRGPAEFLGRLHCDIFQQERYLPNGIDINIKMIPSSDQFSMIGDTLANTTYKVIIDTAVLYVRRVKINPSINIDHNKMLNSGVNMKYPIKRAVVNTFTIPRGTINKVQDNVIQGQLPRRIVLGMVANDAYNGTLKKNPFHFKNFDATFIGLYTDGECISSNPYKPCFAENLFLRSYMSLFEGTGILNANADNYIRKSDYPNGYMLHVFDLSPDLSDAPSNYINPVKHGSLRVELHFGEALTDAINIILYCEYDNLIQIDRARNIITDF